MKGMCSVKKCKFTLIALYFYLTVTLVFKGMLDYPMIAIFDNLLKSSRDINEKQAMLTNLQYDVKHYELIASDIKTSDAKNTLKIKNKIVNYSFRLGNL